MAVLQREILDVLALVRPYTCGIHKVRIGGAFDGGYVINDDLVGIEAALSLGVGNDISFDLALAERGIRSFLYDPAVDFLTTEHPLLRFHKMAWGTANVDRTRTLAGMLDQDRMPHDTDMLLKFDVEGDEWDALLTETAEHLRRYRIITAEFHGLEWLAQPERRRKIKHAFTILTENHVPTHIHPNSTQGVVMLENIIVPKLLEVSFLRRDRSTFTPSYDPIPGPLDAANVDGGTDMVLTPFAHSLDATA